MKKAAKRRAVAMFANIFIADPHRVIVSGPTKLMADRLFSKDIRAGISVVLAAMIAPLGLEGFA